MMTSLEKEFGAEANYIYKSHKKHVKLVKPNRAFLNRYKVGTAKSCARVPMGSEPMAFS